MHMISSPTSWKVALLCGALIGVSLGVLVIAQILFLPTSIYLFGLLGLPMPAFLLAGLLAAKRTGRVSTGTLAGLWSGVFSNIIVWALFIAVVAVYHDAVVSAALSSGIGLDPQNTELYILEVLVFCAISSLLLMMGVGSGLGALGGLIGKRMSAITQRPDSFYPPTS